jgi:multiple sugar transport system permease protein
VNRVQNKDKSHFSIPDRLSKMLPVDREVLSGFAFLLPLLLFLSGLILLPVLGTFLDSLRRDLPYLPNRFVGLENYLAVLRDNAFWDSVRFTTLFVLVSVPLEVILGLIIALVLNETFPGRTALRAMVLIPWAIPAAVSGRIFELIYNYSYGVANYFTQLLGVGPVNWLGTELGAFAAVVLADVWKTTPFAAIILLAGLAAIDQDLYRQAQVDRANLVQRFLKITLPLLKPVLVVTLLFRTVDALRVFDVIFVLTGGGPGGSTDAVSLFAYTYYAAGDFGYGAAVSVILFVVALGFSLAYIKMARFGEELL